MISGLVCSLGGALYYGMNAGMAPAIGSAAMLSSLLVVPLVSFVTAKLPETHLAKVFPSVEEY